MNTRFAALVASLFALFTFTLSSVALAGSGAAPFAIDSTYEFLPTGVRHDPGSLDVEVYGFSDRAGATNDTWDACRLISQDNGLSNNWSFQWLDVPGGFGRTSADEISTMACPYGTFCYGKVFVADFATGVISYGDLAGDGTVSNVHAIPSYLGGAGLSVIGNKIASRGSSDYIELVDINTGAITPLPTCSTVGYTDSALANVVGGFLYLSSNYNGLSNSMDLFRQPFDGTVCTGGRVSLNSVAGYGNPNTANAEELGGVDPLTGDVYYSQALTHYAMRLKLTPTCGDKFISGLGEATGEECDSTSPWPLNGQTCTSLGLGFTGGVLACNACKFDTSNCTSPATCGDLSCNGAETCASCPGDCGVCCGNGAIDAGEQCDLSNLNGASCASVMGAGYTGSLSCSGSCSFVTTACIAPPVCGDLSCNGTETCSSCPGDCGVCCGNSNIDPGEQCDGSNLNGASCATVMGAGYTGSLTCSGSCNFNTAACIAPPVCGDLSCNGTETCSSCPGDCGVCCGNSQIDAGEDCDSFNLNGANCASVMGAGYTGSLSCAACSFVTTACVAPPTCGDGSCNGTETPATCPADCPASCGNGTCDGTETCATCAADCGNCCGNGSIDAGEQCDDLLALSVDCDDVKGGTGWTGTPTCTSCQVDASACTFDWGITSLAGACSLSGEGASQSISFTGGDCQAEYWPIGAVTPSHIKWAAVAGRVLLVGVASAGSATNVTVPEGVSHSEVVDNGNAYQLQWSSGATLAVEGTTYGAVETVWPEVIFGCTDGAISINFASVAVDFSVSGGSQGRLPAGWGVGVNVLTGMVTKAPFDLGGGGTGGAGGSAGAGGEAGSAGVGGDAGSAGMGGSAGTGGDAGSGGTGGSAGVGGEAGSAGSTPVAPTPSGGGDDGGCSTCATGANHGGSNAIWLALGLLALVVSRRRRS